MKGDHYRSDFTMLLLAYLFPVLLSCCLKLGNGSITGILVCIAVVSGAIILIKCKNHLRGWFKGQREGPLHEVTRGLCMGFLIAAIVLLTGYKTQSDLSTAVGVVAAALGIFLLVLIYKNYYLQPRSA